MTQELPASQEAIPEDVRALMVLVARYLAAEDYHFHSLADDCVELHLQGQNLVMRMLIYVHNRHVILRVPAFIRNVDLRRLDVLSAILEFMNGFLDIRFEIAEDGMSLSGAVNHILEDGTLTQTQFSQCLNVLAFMVDDAYPRLMKIIYTGVPAPCGEKPNPDEAPETGGSKGNGTPDKSESTRKKAEPALPVFPEKKNIN
jgi:hypothetical protein